MMTLKYEGYVCMEILQSVLTFAMANIAYIFVVIAILYFVWFLISFIRARQGKGDFQFRMKSFIVFLIVLGIAVYCLATGKDIQSFIN